MAQDFVSLQKTEAVSAKGNVSYYARRYESAADFQNLSFIRIREGLREAFSTCTLAIFDNALLSSAKIIPLALYSSRKYLSPTVEMQLPHREAQPKQYC